MILQYRPLHAFAVSAISILLSHAIAEAAPGFQVSYSSLTTTEDENSASYDISLTEEPTGDVTVTPASGDVTEGTVSGAMTFTPANWMESQTVTITPGASGDGNDGDVMYMITNSVSAPGTNYDAVSAPSVNVTNQNVEGISTVVADQYQNHDTDETGTTSTITFKAIGTPSNDVSIDITSDDPDEALLQIGAGPVSAAVTATLNAGNAYSVTVTIIGQDDVEIDDLQRFSLTTGSTASLDGSFNGIPVPDIFGDNADDDNIVTPDPAFQPDLRVGKKSDITTHRGNNLYSSAPTKSQSILVKAKRKGTAVFFFSLQNDGDTMDSFSLSSQRFHRKRDRVKSIFQDSNGTRFTTADLIRGIGRDLESGEVISFTGKIRVKSEIQRRKADLIPMIRTTSLSDPSRKDSCAAKLKFKN